MWLRAEATVALIGYSAATSLRNGASCQGTNSEQRGWRQASVLRWHSAQGRNLSAFRHGVTLLNLATTETGQSCCCFFVFPCQLCNMLYISAFIPNSQVTHWDSNSHRRPVSLTTCQNPASVHDARLSKRQRSYVCHAVMSNIVACRWN